MSYDIDFVNPDHIVCASFHIPHSVAPTFYFVYKEKGIREIYGLTGLQSLPILLELHNKLIVNRETLIAIENEPSKGWGTWEDIVGIVNEMCGYAAAYQDYVWEGD